ncbi:MAG TPA: MFS transporter [Mycobacteriales bacterium]|nr:MFS transporter [Mycobacteriales bacterium]
MSITVERLTAPAGPRVSWAPLLVVLTGSFMTFLDFFIVNVAIPKTQADLHASAAAVQFIVAGYGLALASGMILGGRLGDLCGRRRMFALGLALFTLASAACGLAPSAGALVASRVVQGAAAALLTPQVLAILSTVYTGTHRARAFGAYGLSMGLAAVFGQLVGGVLIQADIAGSGWRSIYLINVPIGVVTLFLIPRTVPETRNGGRARLDPAGTALISAALIAVVLPLIEGRERGWPMWTWISLVAAPILLAGFVAHQRARAAAGRDPLIDLGLFRERAFSAGLLCSLAFSMVLGSFFLILAIYLQDGRGFSALDSGLTFSCVGAGYFAAMFTARGLAERLGRQVLAVGAVITAAGYGILAETVDQIGTGGSVLWLAPGLAVVGFGIGVVLVPLSETVLRGIRPEAAASASGVLATSQQLGGALGVAVIGVVFYAALDRGFAHAFSTGLVVLGAVALTTAAVVQFLPARR